MSNMDTHYKWSIKDLINLLSINCLIFFFFFFENSIIRSYMSSFWLGVLFFVVFPGLVVWFVYVSVGVFVSECTNSYSREFLVPCSVLLEKWMDVSCCEPKSPPEGNHVIMKHNMFQTCELWN